MAAMLTIMIVMAMIGNDYINHDIQKLLTTFANTHDYYLLLALLWSALL